MKIRAIIVSLSENLINEMLANFESLFRALLEGTQPEVMSLVHGSRLLLAEVNCVWPPSCASARLVKTFFQDAWTKISLRANRSACSG
jgi:hypothetical protein